MIKTALRFLGCSVLFAAELARGAMLPGSESKEWPANAARHVVSIVREAADDTGKKMIEAAEAAAPAGKDWWRGERNNIRQPLALTKDALAYYEGLVRGYQKKAWKRYIEPNSRLEYKAQATHHDSYTLDGKTYKDVHVVTMCMTFEANFTEGIALGVQFKKDRTVVLDAAGAVLAISGDGETEMPMIAI